MPFIPDTNSTFTPDTTSSFIPDKKQKIGKFQAVLDFLDKPAKASMSAIEETQLQVRGERPKSIINVGKSYAKGLLSEPRTSVEMANQAYGRQGISGVPGLGFATAIAADPTTYIGGSLVKGVLGKVVKPALTKVGSALKEIPQVSKTIEAITPTLKEAKKLFSNTTGIPQLDNLIKKYTLEREYLKGKSLEYGVDIRKQIENISKKTGKSVDNISKEVVFLVENPKNSVSLTDDISILSNKLKTHFSNILTKERNAGVPISELSKNARGIEYFPRITTGQVKNYLKQAKVGNAKVWNPKIGNALQRKTGNFTLDEANQFFKDHGIESLGGKKFDEFFMKNPAYATAIRGVSSAKAITSANFLDEVGKIFGKETATAPSFWEKVPDVLSKDLPALANKKFDPEILSEINRVYTKILNPQEMGGIVKVFDDIQNYWKSWTLSPFPKYHIRNMLGNFWNNHLAGVNNPVSYGKALALQHFKKTGSDKLIKLSGISIDNAKSLIDNAERMGVFSKGFYGSDIPQAIEEAISRPSLNPLSTKGFIIKSGRALGTAIEDNARLAHFVNQIEKGSSPMEAALSVKKFLFDYQDLTPFERQVMKRIFPFYAWTRKNIPVQLESIIMKPQIFNPIYKVIQNRKPKDLAKLKYSNPALYDRLPVELKRTIDTVTYVPLEGLLPAADLSRLYKPQNLLMEMLTPYARTPAELLINKSFYQQSEIQDPNLPSQTSEFLHMDIPVKWKYALTTIFPFARMLNSLNGIIKKKDKKEELTPDEVAFEQGISTVYKTKLSTLQFNAYRKLKRKVEDLKSLYRWSIRNGRKEEGKRVMDELKKTVKDIPGIL